MVRSVACGRIARKGEQAGEPEPPGGVSKGENVARASTRGGEATAGAHDGGRGMKRGRADG